MPPRFAVSKREQKVYCAARLKQKRPDIYRAIVKLSEMGHGQLAIQEVLGVNTALVANVQAAESVEISMGKAARSREHKRVDVLATEALVERIADPVARKKIPARDLSSIARNASQVAAELDGEAQVRVDVRVSAVPLEDSLKAYVGGLRSARAPGMGSGAEKLPPGKMGAGAEVAGTAAIGADLVVVAEERGEVGK